MFSCVTKKQVVIIFWHKPCTSGNMEFHENQHSESLKTHCGNISLCREEVEEMIREADLDGDGKVSL